VWPTFARVANDSWVGAVSPSCQLWKLWGEAAQSPEVKQEVGPRDAMLGCRERPQCLCNASVGLSQLLRKGTIPATWAQLWAHSYQSLWHPVKCGQVQSWGGKRGPVSRRRGREGFCSLCCSVLLVPRSLTVTSPFCITVV
jgi:hypothetical protein